MLFKDRQIRNMPDLKIYLDIPETLMLKRRGVRFGKDHVNNYDTKVAIPEFMKYGITQKKYADFIVDASRTQNKVIKEVKEIIKGFDAN